MEEQGPQAIRAAVNQLVDETDPTALGAEIADLVIREIPELAEHADEDLRQTVRATASRSVIEAWEGLRAGVPRDEIVPPVEGVALAVELVHRGVDLGVLLRAWRLGHGLVEARWEQAAERIGLEPELRWHAVAQAFRFFFRYVDAVSVQLSEAYAEERARWVRGAAAVRAEMLRKILNGESVPADRISTALGYELDARHLAFILWADREAPDPRGAGSLEGTAASVARELGDGPSMLLAIGNWTVWGWVTIYDATADRAPERPTLPAGARVAVGAPADGLPGFVRSHQEAMAARRVAGLLGRRSGAFVRHHSSSLLALLSADPLAAARFVESELGELAGPGDSAARLRATLQVYLEENSSPARTARRLSIHKNTVVYRVNQAEEILGRSLTARRPELEAALRLVKVLDGLRAAVARSATGEPPQSGPHELA